MSTSDSERNDGAGLSKSSNVWPHVTTLAGSYLTPQVQMVVCHNGTTAMAFHAVSRAGLVCTKCFKLYTPGLFAKHAQGCDDALPPPEAVTKKWKDTASLWADLLHKKGPKPKYNRFVATDKIWAAKHDQQLAYLLHPSWFTGDKKIKALCITDGCNTVCAINALNSHYRNHKTKTYKLRELVIITGEPDDEADKDGRNTNKRDSRVRTEDNESHEEEEEEDRNTNGQETQVHAEANGSDEEDEDGIHTNEQEQNTRGPVCPEENDEVVRDGPTDSSSFEGEDTMSTEEIDEKGQGQINIIHDKVSEMPETRQGGTVSRKRMTRNNTVGKRVVRRSTHIACQHD